MKTKLGIFTAILGVFLFAGMASAAEPVIFQMADGMFYHPQSGLLRTTKAQVLKELGLVMEEEVVVDEPAPTVTPPSEPVVTNAFSAGTLKDAVIAARAKLQQDVDAWTASGVAPKRVDDYDVYVDITLAVWNSNTKVIEYVDVQKNGTKLKVLTPVPYGIKVARTNGVNSHFDFTDNGEHVVVAVKYPIFDEVVWWHYGHSHSSYDLIPVVYTPWSKRLHQPEIVEWGKATLITMLNDVYADLNARGVMSRAFPDRPLTDIISPELVQGIAVIEHMGLASLSGPKGEYLMDSVFVILGTNQDKAYAYSRSSANAKGVAQFIPSTYKIMTKQTNLGLDPDFETGMANARNALKAMIAYLDAELAYMPFSVRDLYYVDIDRVHEYLAAAYNAGGVRVRRAILMWGDAWSEDHVAANYTQARAILRDETQQYVAKLRVVKDLLRKPAISSITSGTPQTVTPSEPNMTQICFTDGCHWISNTTQIN